MPAHAPSSAPQAPDRPAANPFTPLFGKVPAYLAGRQRIIDDMVVAFEAGDGDPNLCSIFVGARGTGKTALLTYLGQEAQAYGWIAVDVTAQPGMLEDILQRANEQAAHLLAPISKHELTGVEIAPLGSLTWTRADTVPANWRTRMNAVLAQLARTDTGLLITVDELDPALDEMTQLVTTYQHFVRENKKVALIMAGLPHRVSGLLTGASTSFLRRAARHNLGPIPAYEVMEAFQLTVESAGRSIEPDALALAAEHIGGFPYLFQLVGYRAWNVSRLRHAIAVDDVELGARLAREELKERVFDATLAELSPGDIEFLRAMAVDDGKTSRADLTSRLGRSSSWITTYKKRLLDAGVIEEPRRGIFSFALPGFDDYVRSL